ncbi:leucine-rich repeat extensin-like protein 2 [Lotus japonicus]|uniref:leucine-rich repeat extensin-like protein 2 n=1 Tax=Lotus japonicus TaxID=34305 RepID=UPI0025859819|nr:leucine-rich repeat extensin-like protein 2 [Lotus japonicus]
MEPTRAAITSRVTKSSVRNSSKFIILTDEDESDAVDVVSNPTPTLALPSPIPESTPVVQTTTHISPPRPSFFQPSIEEEPLWQMLQNPKPSEPTSPIILSYNPQTSETQAFEKQTSEKPDSEPKSPDHSDRENLSPAPSVSFPTNTQFSSPSNKSESNRQFVQIASERISEIPEHFIQVPSPNRYPGPRPEPLVAPNFTINAVPLNSASPPPPSPPSSPPPQKEKDIPKGSLSNLSSVKSADFEFPNVDTGTSNQNPETNTTAPKTLNIGSPQGTSEATSSNHPPSPETNMSIIPYTYPKPDTL